MARATQELTQVSRSRDLEGGPEAPLSIVLQPIRDYLLGPAGPVLRTLLAGALLMLLIACANVAGLQVSRASRHQRALAIRAALGASPLRLAGQVLVESAVVTALSLTAALAVAWGMLRLLLWLAPGDVPRLGDVALLDVRVLGFGAAATFATAVLCALWPILVARRVDVLSVLAHGASVASDPRGRRVQRAVVVAQVATAVALLFGTALFLRTVRGLDATVLGFDPEQLLAFSGGPDTEDVERWNAFMDRLIARVETLPNVRSAAVALVRPLNGPIGWDNQPGFPGQRVEDPSTWGLNPHMNFLTVSPRYFETMRTRLVRGRLFTAADTHHGARRRDRQRARGAPAVARPGSDRPATARADLSHRREGRAGRRLADGRRRGAGRPLPRPERSAARSLRADHAEQEPRRRTCSSASTVRRARSRPACAPRSRRSIPPPPSARR